MNILFVVLLSFMAGIVQSVSGFGNAIVLMLGFPSIFGVTPGAAISGSIAAANNVTLTLQYRKSLHIKKILVPTLIYTLVGIFSINLSKLMDVRFIGILYGVFLILLAGYFILLDGKLTLTGVFWMIFCTVVSGIGTGLFSIGGPLMAVYYSQIFDDREEFIGNLQFIFSVGGLISFITRIVNGIYTLDMIKYSVLGIAAIYAGSLAGIKLASILKPKVVKAVMYILVLLAGIMTVVKYI